jgi:hypothetical protein
LHQQAAFVLQQRFTRVLQIVRPQTVTAWLGLRDHPHRFSMALID